MVSNVGRSLDDFAIPTSQRADSNDLGQADFLKLMVEQMRNQNPLDPQDNGEFFSQIAQFQTLDAMNVISKAITTLVEISGLSNASSLIGRSIVAQVDQRPDPITGFPRPPQEVSGVVERVTFDGNGAVLHVGGLAIPSSAVTEISDPVTGSVVPTTADVTAELLAQLEALGVFGLDLFDLDGEAGAGDGAGDGVGDGTGDGSTDAAGDAEAVVEPEPAAEAPAVEAPAVDGSVAGDAAADGSAILPPAVAGLAADETTNEAAGEAVA